MYKLPDYNKLLPNFPNQSVDTDNVSHKKDLIEAQLENFNINGTVVDIHNGPVITLYEIKLGKGVSANKISNISTEIAMALQAKRIRVITPIPGKNTIGIEVPNDNPHIVYIKDVLMNSDVNNMHIPIALGKTVSGEVRMMDLAKTPHILMAGQTGSGKSVGINTFISSILAYKTPDEVKLILIDPKEVELTPYENCPHVIGDVITEPQDAVKALKWATDEMDNRYSILAKAGVRNIASYNKTNSMPYIVVIIDEMADLMMTTGKEVESYIIRIAQKARAVGIHLILTTQRPDVKVITGEIKANLPTRIGFRVTNQTDSRIIMDSAGCEKLLGKGDMLFQMNGEPFPERLHGAFIDDTETKTLIEYCVSQQEKQVMLEDNKEEEIIDIRKHPKFDKALELVKMNENNSASFIQRHLEVNFNVSRLMSKALEDI